MAASMHRLPSKSALRQFRLGTLVLLLFAIALPVLLVSGAGAVLHREREVFLLFVGVVCALPVCGGAYLLLGSRARCPLCMNPPLVLRGCQKHRAARRLFGSYRLRVACAVLFLNRFTCPYCGEVTRMEVRERRGGRRQ